MFAMLVAVREEVDAPPVGRPLRVDVLAVQEAGERRDGIGGQIEQREPVVALRQVREVGRDPSVTNAILLPSGDQDGRGRHRRRSANFSECLNHTLSNKLFGNKCNLITEFVYGFCRRGPIAHIGGIDCTPDVMPALISRCRKS